MRTGMALNRYPAFGKLAFAMLFALAVCAVQPSSTTYAKKKPAKHGTIKIQTIPAGFPIEFNGKPEGQTATAWRSWDLAPGLHTVVIILPNGQRWTREINLEAGRIKCVTLNYRPGQPPPPLSPCPFPINLSAPVSVNEGEVITYTSDVSYSGTAALNYTWTVSPANAKILSGLGTPTITVDSTGVGGQRIITTLVVDDGSGEGACRQTAQASTFVPAPVMRVDPAREFDVCCNCSFDDQKARLDNLAVELQNDPSTTTYILAYGGRTSPVGHAARLGARAKDYLVGQRGIDPSRVVVANGGFREEDCVELWVIPRGASLPQPRPTLQPGDARPKPEAPATRRRRN